MDPCEGGLVGRLSSGDTHPGKLGIQGSSVNIKTWDHRGVGNGGNVVLVFHSLLGCEDSSTSWDLWDLDRAWATEWVVRTSSSAYSSRKNSSMGESNERGKRKKGEHLCRTEELVFQKCVEPHQGWKKTEDLEIVDYFILKLK